MQLNIYIYISIFFFSYFSQMPIGRNCVTHYRELSRYCVFSHDEMVCNMAAKAESMDMDTAAIVQKEIIAMVQEEDKLRGKIDKLVSGSNLQGLFNSSLHQLSWGVMKESQFSVFDPRDPRRSLMSARLRSHLLHTFTFWTVSTF